jgi:hypothetical protein
MFASVAFMTHTMRPAAISRYWRTSARANDECHAAAFVLVLDHRGMADIMAPALGKVSSA